MKTYNSMLVGGLVLAAVVAANRSAYATLYNDGGVHTIAGADSDVVISSGTTVNVVPGATVAGMSIDPFGHNAIVVNDSASVLNVTGGSITGGNGSYTGGSGLVGSDGHFDISGGSFTGGSSSVGIMNRPGGQGADIGNFQSLVISGGSFTGGVGTEAGAGLRIGYGSSTRRSTPPLFPAVTSTAELPSAMQCRSTVGQTSL